MDSLNNQVSNILNTDHWSDALLIRDEKGNLGHLKSASKDNSLKVASKINLISEGNLAPQDDSFSPMQNVLGNSQAKSELVFHPDDKEELDFFVKNMPQDDSKKYSVEKIADRIIDKQKLDLDDKNKKIFVNILYNFFRNRKSTVITRELLTNNVLIKKKKIAPETIDIILSVIKGIKTKIDQAGGLVINKAELKAKTDLLFIKEKSSLQKTEKIIKNPVEDLDRSGEEHNQKEEILELADKSLSAQDEIKAALGEITIPKIEEKPSKEAVGFKKASKVSQEDERTISKEKPVRLSEKEVDGKPAAGFSIPSTNEDVSKKEDSIDKKALQLKKEKKLTTAKKEDSKLLESAISLPKVSRPSIGQVSKKAISDVANPVKEEQGQVVLLPSKSVLTGPIQELQSFDLVGFRRLGNTANEKTAKILDKINLLEQESYTKKAQGIAAWRASAVYKLYLQIGAESMTTGKEVANYIAESEQQNKDTLNIEEFSAISDLNKQLRF